MGTTTETIILEYKANFSDLEAGYNKVEQGQKAMAASSQKSMQTLKTGAEQAGQATQQVTKNTSLLKDKLSEIGNNLPFANQAKEVLSLGSAITGAGGAAAKSSVAFNVLKIAVAAVPIFLLVAAIAGLIAYFKRTDEGATRLQGVFAAFNATLDLITGSVVGFGEAAFTAGRSFEDFGSFIADVSKNIGQYILNRALAPIFLLKDGFDALSLAIQGKGAEAFKELKNGVLQFLTGFENLADKTDDFINKALAAAQAAYEWEKSMDALDDKIREDSTTIAKNEAAIARLVIASKNKTIQDEVALGYLDEATRLEKENLALSLQNETKKLKLIQARNAETRASINQDKQALVDELNNTKTSAARKISILKQLRSINDDDAQKEVDQINKIVAIQRSADDAVEKQNNRRDGKLEEIFQNQVKRISEEEILQENLAKQSYLDGTITAQQLEDRLYQIKLQGLNNQKELLVTNSRDIVDIDKSILDLELQSKSKSEKEKADLQKKYDDAATKEEKERLAVEAKYKSDADKDDEAKAKAHRDKIKQILSAGVDVAHTLASGLYNNLEQSRQNDLNNELVKQQKSNDGAQKALQGRLDAGIISQQQYDQQKGQLDLKEAKAEAALKTKQFNENKKAQLINIAIDTAAAIVKTIATLGIPAGIAGAAIAGALGLAQAAVVASQSTPKYLAKGEIDIQGAGTGTSDSIPAKLSRGESVMTAEETSMHKGALLAMRSRNYNEHIQQNYVLPALEKQQRDNISRREGRQKQEQEILKVIASNNVDMSRVEHYLKKNSSVAFKNADEIGKSIAKELLSNKSLYR